MKKIGLVILIMILITSACFAENDYSWTCTQCSTLNNKNYCTKCGAKRPDWFCTNCGQKWDATDNFCGQCGSAKGWVPGEKDPIIQNALSLIIDVWNQEYVQDKENGREFKPYLQIIYTRQFDLIEGRESTEKFNKYFPEVVSVIVFDLHANYWGDEPVYSYSGINSCVAIMRDGTMEVVKTNPFLKYSQSTYIFERESWVTEKDYGTLYNGIYIE